MNNINGSDRCISHIETAQTAVSRRKLSPMETRHINDILFYSAARHRKIRKKGLFYSACEPQSSKNPPQLMENV